MKILDIKPKYLTKEHVKILKKNKSLKRKYNLKYFKGGSQSNTSVLSFNHITEQNEKMIGIKYTIEKDSKNIYYLTVDILPDDLLLDIGKLQQVINYQEFDVKNTHFENKFIGFGHFLTLKLFTSTEIKENKPKVSISKKNLDIIVLETSYWCDWYELYNKLNLNPGLDERIKLESLKKETGLAMLLEKKKLYAKFDKITRTDLLVQSEPVSTSVVKSVSESNAPTPTPASEITESKSPDAKHKSLMASLQKPRELKHIEPTKPTSKTPAFSSELQAALEKRDRSKTPIPSPITRPPETKRQLLLKEISSHRQRTGTPISPRTSKKGKKRITPNSLRMQSKKLKHHKPKQTNGTETTDNKKKTCENETNEVMKKLCERRKAISGKSPEDEDDWD